MSGGDESHPAAVAALAQLAAMRRGDWAAALELATAELRARLTPARFGSTAREGYGPLLASVDQQVEQVVAEAGRAQVRIALMLGDRSAAFAIYELVDEDGEWRVAGVALGSTLTATASLNGGRPKPA
jgi:hypothetical protein